MLIGITGKKGSGKDTFASFFPSNFKRLAFADAIKIHIETEYGIAEPLDKESVIESKDGFLEVPYPGITYRKLCQDIGRYFRGIDPDHWVNILKYKVHGNVIITDVRFDNEAHFIKRMHGNIIHIVRDGLQYDSDVSERGINADLVNYKVINNGTIQDLKEKYNLIGGMLLG